MELRHLRYFVALAEELHFVRAAERLHIEQSPLSRTIKELEERVGVKLFNRTRRGTHLTQAGEAFLKEIRRVFIALDQAKESAQAIEAGHMRLLRVAISDGVIQSRLASLLAVSRSEEPTVAIRLSEVPLTELLRGLRNDTFDVGFALTEDTYDGIEAMALWQEPLVVAIPPRHPLLAHSKVPLDELLRYPLIMCHPEYCQGHYQQVEKILQMVDTAPDIAEQATSLTMTLTLVAAGYGVGIVTASQITTCQVPDIVSRPLSIEATLKTYLLRKADKSIPPQLSAFIDRATRKLKPQS